MAFYSADALAHCSSRPILTALPKRTSNSWSVARGYHIGYHCFINAAIFRYVSLFFSWLHSDSRQEEEPYSIDPSTDIRIISEMEISHYSIKLIASHKIGDHCVMHFS